MKRAIAVLLGSVVITLGAKAQTLLYEWAFTNQTDTATNSAATYAITPGTGNLIIQNVSGNVDGVTGADGINPLCYFTNANIGPGVKAMGAFVANGQDYDGGNSAVAMATNLNLGNLEQFTMTFWFRLDPAFTSGTLARLVDFGALPAYDSGGTGAGNTNGIGAALGPSFDAEMQSGMDATPYPFHILPLNAVLSVLTAFPSGLQNDGATWYFAAVSYDESLSETNFLTWLGSANQSVQMLENPSLLDADFGYMPFTTNATVKIGNDFSPTAPRGLTFGAIADVRIYSGILEYNLLEYTRTFQGWGQCSPWIVTQPVSVTNQVGGSCSFLCLNEFYNVDGCPCPGFGCFFSQWKSNGIPVSSGPTDGFSQLILNDITLSANGASFVCTIMGDGGTIDSLPATLVLQPTLTGVLDTNAPDHLLLNWNFGTLQESTVETGPYTDVAGSPISPYSVAMTNQQQYFRVRN
jgi:hypothetical protein